jgi:hypothetical protein
MADILLPYPSQLPQDYYAKNLPPVQPPPQPVTPPTPPVITQPPTPNLGGVWYGSAPPPNPQYGWLWTDTYGRLFVFMEPGIWSQIATNW